MAGDATSVWLPIITFLGGFGSKGLLELLQDRRSVAREREGRQAERQAIIEDKRNEFQHETLIELQDACVKLIRLSGRANIHDVTEHRKTGRWQAVELPPELDQDSLTINQSVSKLIVRVRDGRVRQLAKDLSSSCAGVAVAQSEARSDSALRQASETSTKLHERIGEVLRGLDTSTA